MVTCGHTPGACAIEVCAQVQVRLVLATLISSSLGPDALDRRRVALCTLTNTVRRGVETMPKHERGMGSITVSARGHVTVIEILFLSVNTAKWMPATCALRSPSPCHMNTHLPQAHAPSPCHGRRKLKPYLGKKGTPAFPWCEGPGAPGHTGVVGSPAVPVMRVCS